MTQQSPNSRSRRHLSSFTGKGYEKGGTRIKRMLWVAFGQPMQASSLCPLALRIFILRAFGANIGAGAKIRHDVRIHWPWKLSIGANSWVGVGAWLLNLEDIRLGADVCVSQQVLLCTGSHRADDPAFEFDNAPITVQDGVWIATRATVLRGVTVGANALIGACAVVRRDIPPGAAVYPPEMTLRTALPVPGSEGLKP